MHKQFPPSCTRPAADNLQHPGHYFHRWKRPEAALPRPALRPLLQRPQSPQHGRRRPRQHQSERQREAGGRCASQQRRCTHHHLSATGDVHHLYRDHDHPVHHDHSQAALTTYHSGKAVADGSQGEIERNEFEAEVNFQFCEDQFVEM